jgi:hypothetical protein
MLPARAIGTLREGRTGVVAMVVNFETVQDALACLGAVVGFVLVAAIVVVVAAALAGGRERPAE